MDAASKTGIDDIRELIENSGTAQQAQNIKFLLLMKFICFPSRHLMVF